MNTKLLLIDSFAERYYQYKNFTRFFSRAKIKNICKEDVTKPSSPLSTCYHSKDVITTGTNIIHCETNLAVRFVFTAIEMHSTLSCLYVKVLQKIPPVQFSQTTKDWGITFKYECFIRKSVL